MKAYLAHFKIKRMLWYGLYMLVLLLVQNMVINEFRLAGVCAMFLPAAAVAVGMFEGATWGAVFSLIMGIFADMAYVENTVMFTLLMPALSFGAGFIAQFFVNRRFFAYMGTACVGLLITALVQMMRVAAADGVSPIMISTVVMQTLWSIPAAAVAYLPPAKWIE